MAIQRPKILQNHDDMKKKLTVSIGIPAYNEEANIQRLLKSLLSQKETNFTLKEIIVFSDQSTDSTVKKVKAVPDSRIKLLENEQRLGQASGQNKLLDHCSGDLILLMNADVVPTSSTFISEAIKPFYQNPKLGITSPDMIPSPAHNFFEKIINHSVEFRKAVPKRWRSGNNLYLCCGAARVFSKQLAKQLRWPKLVSEDAYSYLWCITNDYTFQHVPKAQVYFKSPDNFSDHKKQSSRFLTGVDDMSRFFDPQLVAKEYTIPSSHVILGALNYFFKNPLLFTSYVFIFLYIKLSLDKSQYLDPIWDSASSSKKLAS